MDSNSSKLLVVRTPTAAKYPTLVAGTWFCLCAAAACAVFMAGTMLFHGGTIMGAGWRAILPYLLLATFGALIAGAVVGRVILTRRLKPGMSALVGMGVVFVSHLLFGVAVGIWGPNSFSGVIPTILGMAAFSATAGGIITFPMGAAGGYYLAVFRDTEARPRGCKLHGYRVEDDSAAPPSRAALADDGAIISNAPESNVVLQTTPAELER